MKKISVIGLMLVLLLAGCAPQFEKQEEVVQETTDKKEKAIVPKYKISDKYYRTLIPFKEGKARGLVVSNLNTRYDIEEFETGLMRIAQNNFDPDNYLFQEGQMIESKTIKLWLNREYTAEQAKEKKVKESENIGLNPVDPGKGDIESRNTENPIYLAHILEQDYLVNDNNQVSLGGVAIGLALNSVHYYQKEAYGATYEVKIPQKEMEDEGKKIAAEVIKRVRTMEGMKNVPITIALFEQKKKSSVVPGNFISYSHVNAGSSTVDGWQDLKEHYYLFPSDSAKKDYREDWTVFTKFKDDVEEYFPNFNGVIGRGFYVDDQLQEMNIDIPIQFYGKAESIGFTQYVTGLIMDHFPEYISVQVSISSVNGQEALIIRKANQEEPTVHIYE